MGVFLGQSGFIFLFLLPGKHRGLIPALGAVTSPSPAWLSTCKNETALVQVIQTPQPHQRALEPLNKHNCTAKSIFKLARRKTRALIK